MIFAGVPNLILARDYDLNFSLPNFLTNFLNERLKFMA